MPKIIHEDVATGITICAIKGPKRKDAPLKLHHAIAERVAEATSRENMKPVTADEILNGSVVAYLAIAEGKDGPELAGFARQLRRCTQVSCLYMDFWLNEIGTVWVNPAHRGKHVASQLVSQATLVSRAMGLTPFGICNEGGACVFEESGYLRAANMGGRVLEVYQPEWESYATKMPELWEMGLGHLVGATVLALPRITDNFNPQDIEPIAPPLALAA